MPSFLSHYASFHTDCLLSYLTLLTTLHSTLTAFFLISPFSLRFIPQTSFFLISPFSLRFIPGYLLSYLTQLHSAHGVTAHSPPGGTWPESCCCHRQIRGRGREGPGSWDCPPPLPGLNCVRCHQTLPPLPPPPHRPHGGPRVLTGGWAPVASPWGRHCVKVYHWQHCWVKAVSRC